MNLIGLDFETYGAVDLPTHGLARYVGDASFQPLIAAFAERSHNGVLDKISIDLTSDMKHGIDMVRDYVTGKGIVAHNAPFERAVLAWMGIHLPASSFIDSAVVARAAGAGGSLEAAAPQLLNVDKLASGKNLIKLFSVPGKYQALTEERGFDQRIIFDNSSDWSEFIRYCELDAELGLCIVEEWQHALTQQELAFSEVTMDMNQRGWCIDIPLVEEMNQRYLENLADAEANFRSACGAPDLNLNSLKQLKEWCADRGIRANSFDEKHVAALLKKVDAKLSGMRRSDPKFRGYDQVYELLRTKQMLGGSSLKKLKVMLDTAVQLDAGTYRLKDQYLHCGAGQSLRTTGRSVQMQNLKRLSVIDDMRELANDATYWDNEKMGRNMRQVFTSSSESGFLIVGDFSSVEARGLAWAAEEDWKMDAFRKDMDLYKVSASRQFGVDYDAVSKGQRQFGKVGELSCGYQAGPDAVKSFAAGMGVELNEAEAAKVVYDWRDANPKIVWFWGLLDDMLQSVLNGSGVQKHYLPDGMVLEFEKVPMPRSLWDIHPSSMSIRMSIKDHDGSWFMKRYFHGCYPRGRNVAYYKPSDRKTGDLWRNTFIDPKTKQLRFHELYGGKIAGILTQSLCREIFMRSMRGVDNWLMPIVNVDMVGQFHDELVLDWQPGPMTVEAAMLGLEVRMSTCAVLPTFPLAAEVKHDYRYTK